MMRVAMIGGGRSSEHEVSLASAAGMSAALRRRGHAVDELTIGLDGIWRRGDDLLGPSPATSMQAAIGVLAAADVVVPAVHGPHGEDGTLAALCDLAGVRYVGSGVGAGALAMDKWATKLAAEAVGIRTARGRLVSSADIGDVEYEGPVVVKPVSAGSSHGVSLAESAEGLHEGLLHAARFDDRILIEEVVCGREIDVAVLREAGGARWAAPPLEIHMPDARLFDAETKYDGSARFTTPAGLTRTERSSLIAAATRLFDALGCSGVARVDFFLTDTALLLNEVNTMPGMTEHSQVPRMFAAAGVEYDELVERLVASAPTRRDP